MSLEATLAAIQAVESEFGAYDEALVFLRQARIRGRRAFFIGNGGSAAIASHMATDFQNRAKLTCTAMNDLAALTAISNDYGYKFVFDFQLRQHAQPSDVLFAVSSSGKSPNIVEATYNARHKYDLGVITFSGFAPNNPLRGYGHVNFYVPSADYGVVETTHLAILHTLLERLADG